MDLNPFERFKLRRQMYKKMLGNRDRIKKEKEEQEKKRKKREDYIKSIDPNKGIYDCFHNILWEELIEYSSTVKELDEDFMVIMKLKPWKDDDGAQNGGKDVEIERIKREKKNAIKRYARQILLLEDKDTDDAQKKHGEDLANSYSNDRVDECDNVT